LREHDIVSKEPMRHDTPHVLTESVVSVRRSYLTDVVVPFLAHAQKRMSSVGEYYDLAGHRVVLHFYTPVLHARFARALAHRATPGSRECELTVHLLDVASSDNGITVPWSRTEYIDEQATNTAMSLPESFLGVYQHGEESLTLFDRANRTAYFIVRDARTLPRWHDAAPLRTLLGWFFAEHDLNLVHGSVVGTGGRSVLLTAPGGSGKSTTALDCTLNGMSYIGDDYVAIAQTKDSVTAHSLYATAKVTADTLARLPALRDHGVAAPETQYEKRIFSVCDAFPERTASRAELQAIVVPHIHVKEESTCVPTRKGHALWAIAPTTLMQQPLARHDTLQRLRSLTERLPCYSLALGRDTTNVPEMIASLLAVP